MLSSAAATFVAFGIITPTHAKSLETNNICSQAIRSVDSEANTPTALLTAISHVESGRWDAQKEALFAWPWTVTNGSDGQYFPTKDAAIAQVRKLQSKGIRNIDVGCMQINLKYHPNAFEDLESALDPKTNARYAAKLLNSLFETHKTWAESIRRYHSSNPKFNRPYHDKVVRQWNSSRRVAATEHRRRVIAEHRAQREKWRIEREAQIADARSTQGHR
ncbi:MAG: transglycosylase SLT domain-containing protein [Alphaproteobacteria bacterium]|nr:transglycosylase SLT domain-containing protein [Alphaproteobacteria bacterium]